MSKIEHGVRNMTLSSDLYQGKVYYDWCVTIAFYSAIHFVEGKILPCLVQGSHCKNINEVKAAFKMKGRHEARERLVFENLDPKTAAYYKWLDDKSRYARYTTFKVTQSEAEKAQVYLKQIHQLCNPAAPAI